MNLSELIIKHEGIRLKPYRDTVGKLTIGVGRNLDDNGITEAEAMFLLSTDIARINAELDQLSFTRHLNAARRAAILSMLFNLGLPRFVKFKKMIAALDACDYAAAADEALDSLWAYQVPVRAKEIAAIIKNGCFEQKAA